jgi:hypothetical protein
MLRSTGSIHMTDVSAFTLNAMNAHAECRLHCVRLLQGARSMRCTLSVMRALVMRTRVTVMTVMTVVTVRT